MGIWAEIEPLADDRTQNRIFSGYRNKDMGPGDRCHPTQYSGTECNCNQQHNENQGACSVHVPFCLLIISCDRNHSSTLPALLFKDRALVSFFETSRFPCRNCHFRALSCLALEFMTKTSFSKYEIVQSCYPTPEYQGRSWDFGGLANRSHGRHYV